MPFHFISINKFFGISVNLSIAFLYFSCILLRKCGILWGFTKPILLTFDHLIAGHSRISLKIKKHTPTCITRVLKKYPSELGCNRFESQSSYSVRKVFLLEWFIVGLIALLLCKTHYLQVWLWLIILPRVFILCFYSYFCIHIWLAKSITGLA